jgi:hypothetical protein
MTGTKILTGLALIVASGIMLSSGFMGEASSETQIEEGAILRIIVSAKEEFGGEVLADSELATAESLDKCDEAGTLITRNLVGVGGGKIDASYLCRMAPMYEVEELERTLGEQNLAGGHAWDGK